ncbi:MAG: D-cysteine desulfhydrase [Deltaproteobacteria bacterium]|jgi:D-cysteine desulfhydrase|nr:D-cysteine desulfhydrase [Deltaproteobacteria bacterium]
MNLHKFPRRGYVKSPTPIEFLPRLSQILQVDVFVKRDDLLEGCLGGNKTRKLDFSIAKALSQGADAIVTCGAIQSNHCRLTLAWSIRENLDCHLILEERVKDTYDPRASGNNFIFNLLGAASIKIVPGGADVQSEMEALSNDLLSKGKKPFVIPGGAADPIGALGYAACAQEITAQLLESDYGLTHLVCASGSGGTQAGLLAGFAASNTPLKVIGVNVRRPTKKAQEDLIKTLTADTLKLLDCPHPLDPKLVLCLEKYLGPGYSLPSPQTLEAVRLLAKTEAILVDPVYTGKALAGLMDLARTGYFKKGERVLFLHTGGFPALFAYLDQFPDLIGPAFKG